MVVHKDKVYLYWLAGAMFIIAIMPLFNDYLDDGDLDFGLIYVLWFFIFTLPFSIFGVLILRTGWKKIYLSESGIKVDDFSKSEILWSDVTSVEIKRQRLYRHADAYWLVIDTVNNEKYLTKKVIRANKFAGVTGLCICNLTTYDIDRSYLLEMIENYLGEKS